ncbi:MAG: hypothetical protein K6B74_07165 [Ruminococcus sp.]|nr:hypothetical protein [Ruminococcus sp.]
MSDNDSLLIQFIKQLFISLLIQATFLAFACISYGATDKMIYFSKIIMAGCFLAVLINIVMAVKSHLKSWEKIVLILLMPTNLTYLLLDRYGLAHKVLDIFSELFLSWSNTI